MAGFASAWAREFYARTYDQAVEDWPGELDFYAALVQKHVQPQEAVLELACGTGRIAIRLARSGTRLVGLDSSRAMLAVAREKSQDANLTWVEGDMRSFALRESFPLIIIPAHSFQNLVLVEDQISALDRIYHHLQPGGRLVLHLDHLDLNWLSQLKNQADEEYAPAGTLKHPETGQTVNTLERWTYDSFTQTATLRVIWEWQDSPQSERMSRLSGPLDFHCFFPYEVEHLLARAGFEIESLQGDFLGNPLATDSSEMIWTARRPV